ncbi:helix-turn-helix domain-containing protein [Pseudonocardia saturnea]
MAGGATESGRSVASKVTAILLVFARGSTYSLTELARLTGLPVSTAHRLAGELTARRLLERTEDGDYRIGLPLRRIGNPPSAVPDPTPADPTSPGPAGRPDLLRRAGWAMADLVVATGSVVRLGVPDGAGVAVAEMHPGGPAPDALTRHALPAHATTLGRTLLAFGPPGAAERAIAAVGSAEAGGRLRQSLRVIRLTRVAVSTDPPARVAMPVFGAGGAVLAALELTVPDLQTDLAGARAALAVATGSLSRELATMPGAWPGPTLVAN